MKQHNQIFVFHNDAFRTKQTGLKVWFFWLYKLGESSNAVFSVSI